MGSVKKTMNKNQPRVSIGLPVYNGEKYLRKALESILAQTFKNFELIISDNASTDRTKGICQEYADKDQRIRYYRQNQNFGAARNFNLVFELSTGEYFKWAAHDDVCAPKYLQRCVNVLDREPSVVLCYPRISYIDEDGRPLTSGEGNLSVRGAKPSDRVRQLVSHELRSNDVFWSIFGLMRASALRATSLIGRFNASDQVLLMNLALLGQFYQIQEKLFYRRKHPLESMLKHRTPQERAKWFDPTNTSRIILSSWRLIFEHFKVVKNNRLGWSQTLKCCCQIARYAAKRWRVLGGELKMCAAQILGWNHCLRSAITQGSEDYL